MHNLNYPKFTIPIKYDVLWLYISMNYHFGVKIFEGKQDGSNHKFSLSLRKSGHLRQMISEISSFHEMHNEKETVFILEGIKHIDYKSVPEE